ncbi:hypothetical protein L484_016618 [Morus notabilis]|uniref:Uncharacterized protein n=1 Tax=Morus notabilis TaxID=981085 RepID=W9R7I6_9ROSA|nr:hypothetical protein L484_016618 [Morus notabilis]
MFRRRSGLKIGTWEKGTGMAGDYVSERNLGMGLYLGLGLDRSHGCKSGPILCMPNTMHLLVIN